jgi:hypothetical protein
LIDEDEPLVSGKDDRRQLEDGRARDLLAEGAADRVDDIGLAALQHGEPGGVIRDDPEDQTRRLTEALFVSSTCSSESLFVRKP